MGGGFAVDNATLTRFFALHFLLPFTILAITMLHLLFLHETGSNNPLGLNSDGEKIPFHSYHTFKDLVGFLVLLFFLSGLVLFSPQLLGDPENFIPAKLGGVIALVAAVAILFILPLTYQRKFRAL